MFYGNTLKDIRKKMNKQKKSIPTHCNWFLRRKEKQKWHGSS